jgi:hypothetical protein
MARRNTTTLLIAGLIALAALAAVFVAIAPETLADEANQMDLVRSLAILGLLGMSLAARPIPAAFALRAALVWIALGALLALVYLNKDTLLGLLH